jgi:hypothetical protein
MSARLELLVMFRHVMLNMEQQAHLSGCSATSLEHGTTSLFEWMLHHDLSTWKNKFFLNAEERMDPEGHQ